MRKESFTLIFGTFFSIATFIGLKMTHFYVHGLCDCLSGKLFVYIIPFFGLVTVIFFTNNTIVKLIKRRETEFHDKIKISEEKYSELFETITDGIVFSDLEGNVISCNKGFLDMLGYTMKEIKTKSCSDLTPSIWQEEDEKILIEQIIKRGCSELYEKEYIRKDGEVFPASVKGWAIKGKKSKQNGVWYIIRDVTEHKRIEKNMRNLNNAIEQADEAIVITDIEGTIEYANPAFERITGYSVSGALGKNMRMVKSGKQSGEFYKEMWEAITAGNVWRGSLINRKKDETFYDEEMTITPVKEPDGTISHFIAGKRDVTLQRKMEKVLLQSENLKSLGTMASGVAHDFNNILAIISGSVQLLETNYYKDHGELTEVLHTIQRATHDGAQIAGKMLKFTKTEKDAEEFISYNLKDIMKQAIDFTRPRWKNMAQAKGVSYHIDIKGIKEEPDILCNPSALREVLTNIINNAVDAMPDGGDLSFSTWNNKDSVFINISDTGEGMTEEVKKSIFDPFFTTKMANGTGLGMSTAYGIIAAHGGKIDLDSEEGKGTTFTLQFPVAIKAVSPKESPETEQKIESKNLRILVVDDDEDIRDILDKFLLTSGHKVKTVDDGAEAIKLVKSEYFDLVLCDMAMQEIHGYDVIKVLNGLDNKPKVGIITGWGEKLKLLEDEELKVDFIIKKPFDFSALSRHINKAFNT